MRQTLYFKTNTVATWMILKILLVLYRCERYKFIDLLLEFLLRGYQVSMYIIYRYIVWKEEPGSLQHWKTSKCHTGNLSL